MQNTNIERPSDRGGAPAAAARAHAAQARTSRRARVRGAAWVAALLAAPWVGEAYERVEYNGKLYACEHRCSITTFKDGSAHIRDALGGWAARIEVDGGAIVDEEGKT